MFNKAFFAIAILALAATTMAQVPDPLCDSCVVDSDCPTVNGVTFNCCYGVCVPGNADVSDLGTLLMGVATPPLSILLAPLVTALDGLTVNAGFGCPAL